MNDRLRKLLKTYLFSPEQRRLVALLVCALCCFAFIGHSIQYQLNLMLHEYMEDQLGQNITMMSQMDNEIINRRLHWLEEYGKAIEALCVSERLAPYGHAVEAVGTQAVPGQMHQAQRVEDLMQCLPFGQSSHIVETGIEGHGTSAITLQATTRLRLTFQHQHTAPRKSQLAGTNQASKAATDNDDVVFHICIKIFSCP